MDKNLPHEVLQFVHEFSFQITGGNTKIKSFNDFQIITFSEIMGDFASENYRKRKNHPIFFKSSLCRWTVWETCCLTTFFENRKINTEYRQILCKITKFCASLNTRWNLQLVLRENKVSYRILYIISVGLFYLGSFSLSKKINEYS